ncbi:MAG: HEPN domain-containing protein [Planctomycetes bacterium]|nr:HEPN domain-containing protein [Planctomycetota bacterium]
MKKDKKTEARNWFIQARTEFEDALDLEKRGRFYLSLFLYQQATEKALKAFLFYKGEEELFTHSVKDLTDIAIAYDKDFENIKSAKDLDRYYIPTRYPNGLAGNVPAEFFDKPEECESAQKLAKAAIELVEKKIWKAIS